MIKRQEEIDEERRNEYYNKLKLLGGYYKFEKPIRFRLTPHTPTKYIYEISINDNFDDFQGAGDAILQRLRYLTHEIL